MSIRCGLTLKVLFQLPFRATQGLIRSLVRILKLEVDVPTYSLLCKWQKNLKIVLGKRCAGEGLHILADSTGLKIYDEGEWKTRKHGQSKRRVWRKLHVFFNGPHKK